MPSTSRFGLTAVALLLVFSGVAATMGLWKLLGISWVAFVAMAGAIPLGRRAAASDHPRPLVWSYGLASGAMITSAAVFLVPQAITYDPAFGGFGIALGVISGFGTHTVGHRLTHRFSGLDHTAVELTAHTVAAGSIIGLVYATQPSLGPLLGLAIVSHKGPAGYAAARRLVSEGRPAAILLIPASSLGIMALLFGLLSPPSNPLVSALVFGFASGVFLHLAMDFLPRCELGSDIYEVACATTEDAHSLLDDLRMHAVTSTALGGLVVFAAWFAVNA